MSLQEATARLTISSGLTLGIRDKWGRPGRRPGGWGWFVTILVVLGNTALQW